MIKVKNLWKRYGNLQVLKGLNLEILTGETVVILGRSGVGKSVLLRQIMGIETADEGSIEFDRKMSEGSIGMLFQGAALFDSMTVGQNTAFYLHQHPDPHTGKWLSEKEVNERVSWALDCVDLPNTQSKMPSDLSGGMRKRAALARVIAYKPMIVLYDEPTTGLDPITSMQINGLINKTQKDLKATSIVVTHDIKSALEVGDRIAFHHEGQIRHIAPKDEFFNLDDPLIQQFFTNAIFTKDAINHHKETR
jgi:phospholipid/cholesterol/gamma-HCH transport system ATP-binding protein